MGISKAAKDQEQRNEQTESLQALQCHARGTKEGPSPKRTGTGKTDRQTDRQADRQTDKQTDTHTRVMARAGWLAGGAD